MSEGLVAAWFDDVSSWEIAHWSAWGRLIEGCSETSFFLDPRSVRTFFEGSNRSMWAVVWHEAESAEPAHWKGVALVEDTYAESHQFEAHVASRAKWIKRLSRRLHGNSGVLRFPVRVMGSVLGSGGHAYRFDSSISSTQRRQLVSRTLRESLRERPGTLRPRVALVKDFPLHELESGVSPGCNSRWFEGWVDLEFDPVMRLPLNPEWEVLDDYLNELRTKARTKVKRIMTCSRDCSLEEWSADEVASNVHILYDLYLQVYGNASFRLGTLMPEDLIHAKQHWGDDFKVQVIRYGGKVVAFQCGYVTATTVEAFFVGFHRGLNRDLSLYQRMLIEFVRWGIQSGAKEVVMGRTALDIKSSVGALPEHWYCSVHFKNRVLHAVARQIAQRIWPRHAKLKRPWKEGAYADSHPPFTRDAWV